MEDKKYMTNGARYSERYSEQIAPDRTNWLRVDMYAFADNGSHKLALRVYTHDLLDKQEVHFNGSLNELIELILLGKSYKTQLQAEGKKEPIAISASEIRELQNNG